VRPLERGPGVGRLTGIRHHRDLGMRGQCQQS
jgi:hypothetical protein